MNGDRLCDVFRALSQQKTKVSFFTTVIFFWAMVLGRRSYRVLCIIRHVDMNDLYYIMTDTYFKKPTQYSIT